MGKGTINNTSGENPPKTIRRGARFVTGANLSEDIHDFLGPPFGRSGYSISVKGAQSAWDV